MFNAKKIVPLAGQKKLMTNEPRQNFKLPRLFQKQSMLQEVYALIHRYSTLNGLTLKFYKCACATPHLHKISNLTKKIVSTGQFTCDYKVLKRYMIRKTVKQGIIWPSNMQIRYFKDLCEPCLNAPESSLVVLLHTASATPLSQALEKRANHQNETATFTDENSANELGSRAPDYLFYQKYNL